MILQRHLDNLLFRELTALFFIIFTLFFGSLNRFKLFFRAYDALFVKVAVCELFAEFFLIHSTRLGIC